MSRSIKKGPYVEERLLKRIEEITAQFDGIIDINTNNNIFTISIMFPLVEGANEYRNN